MTEAPTPMPDIVDFRAWDDRLFKDYLPGYIDIFDIYDEALAQVKEVIWTKNGVMSEAVRVRSWQQIR